MKRLSQWPVNQWLCQPFISEEQQNFSYSKILGFAPSSEREKRKLVSLLFPFIVGFDWFLFQMTSEIRVITRIGRGSWEITFNYFLEMTLTSFFQEIFRTVLLRLSLERRTLMTIHDPGLRLVSSQAAEQREYLVNENVIIEHFNDIGSNYTFLIRWPWPPYKCFELEQVGTSDWKNYVWWLTTCCGKF